MIEDQPVAGDSTQLTQRLCNSTKGQVLEDLTADRHIEGLIVQRDAFNAGNHIRIKISLDVQSRDIDSRLTQQMLHEAVALAGFGLIVALRTGSAEATQAMFPLIFVAVFVSSAFFPTELMRGWYQEVAEANPFTLIINPTRELVITGWDWSDFGQAVGFTLLLAVFSLSLAYRAYLGRLRSS